MLKLLLIGFTQTNANVIQIFIEMTFKEIHVDSVIRDVNEQKLSLPALNEQQRDCDIFIIDFEGVGLDLNDKNISQKLEIYTVGKPILFLSRQNSVVPISLVHYEWLTVPYNRQQMNDSVKKLLEKIKTNTSANLAKTSQQTLPAMNANFIKTTADGQGKKLISQKIKTMDSQNSQEEVIQIFDTLASVFVGIHEQPFFNFAKNLQTTNDFTQITISHYDIYFNPVDKSVVVMNLERVIDSFMVGLRQENITFIKLDSAEFRKKVNLLLTQGAKQYNISQLIWLIGIEIVQTKRYAYHESHVLKFEARYMPNITGIKFLPKHVTPVIASCLGRARDIKDFNILFPNLTNEQINQVLILLGVSQTIRVDVLLDSAKQKPVSVKPPPQSEKNVNVGVQKANKTGFLKRLLGRLGI